MTTRTALRPPPPGEYAHLEPLPDPLRTPDMQQHIRIAAFDSYLRAYFAQRTDVLVCGGGYLRHEAGNPPNGWRRIAWSRSASIPTPS